MITTALHIRTATADDLDAINDVISAALMTWDLPERVKRLSLPSYIYDIQDLQHYQIAVACIDNRIIGVISMDSHYKYEFENTQHEVMLIHGLYIHPAQQHIGIGTRLFQHTEYIAQQQSTKRLLLRAHKHAIGFFTAMGMTKIPVSDHSRDYEQRYWKLLK